MILVCYEKNRKLFKHEYGNSTHHRNEIGLLCSSNPKLYDKIESFLALWTKIKTQGASEGEGEGDASRMKLRLRDRYRLQNHIFGLEHSIAGMFKLHTDDMHVIARRCVEYWVNHRKVVYHIM